MQHNLSFQQKVINQVTIQKMHSPLSAVPVLQGFGGWDTVLSSVPYTEFSNYRYFFDRFERSCTTVGSHKDRVKILDLKSDGAKW